MKNILIIHTGGTFRMTPADPEKTLEPRKIESLMLTSLAGEVSS